MYGWLDGLVQKNIGFSQKTLLDESRVLNSKCPEHFAWEGV
jgi:hypothetical protein